jgi:hypothetical protein
MTLLKREPKGRLRNFFRDLFLICHFHFLITFGTLPHDICMFKLESKNLSNRKRFAVSSFISFIKPDKNYTISKISDF